MRLAGSLPPISARTVPPDQKSSRSSDCADSKIASVPS